VRYYLQAGENRRNHVNRQKIFFNGIRILISHEIAGTDDEVIVLAVRTPISTDVTEPSTVNSGGAEKFSARGGRPIDVIGYFLPGVVGHIIPV